VGEKIPKSEDRNLKETEIHSLKLGGIGFRAESSRSIAIFSPAAAPSQNAELFPLRTIEMHRHRISDFGFLSAFGFRDSDLV